MYYIAQCYCVANELLMCWKCVANESGMFAFDILHRTRKEIERASERASERARAGERERESAMPLERERERESLENLPLNVAKTNK